MALYFMWYNFGRVHQTLRVTPAMEARVSDHVCGRWKKSSRCWLSGPRNSPLRSSKWQQDAYRSIWT
jgi:hypothetical protein